jgi:large subunit ribosomal protein L15
MEKMDIVKPQGATRRRKMVGRGAGSGHGSTSGRGSKGQNSRSGGGTRLGFEGGQMPLYRRVARRGFSNYPFKKQYSIVDVGALNVFADGDTVDRAALLARGLIQAKVRLVKILGSGELSRRLTVSVDKISAGAAKKIEAAGGSVAGAPSEAGKEVRRKPDRDGGPAGSKEARPKPDRDSGPAGSKEARPKPDRDSGPAGSKEEGTE